MINTIITFVGGVFLYPGILTTAVAALLLTGFDRVFVAKMQKRVGPPIIQPFYDFFKLCGKETIVPAAANRTVFLMAPIVGLASLFVLQLFIPIGGFTVFGSWEIADIIVILYLLLMPAAAMILGASASGSPYAGIGLSREMVTVIACEMPLVMVFLAVGKMVGNATGEGVVFSLRKIVEFQLENGSLLQKGSMVPAAIAFLILIPAESGSHPFDAAEAETEICEGMLAEYGGAPLALFKLMSAVKMLTMSSLFVTIFFGGLTTGILVLDGLIRFALCVVVIFFTVSLFHAVTARLKIEQLFKFFWTGVSFLALMSLIIAWYGL